MNREQVGANFLKAEGRNSSQSRLTSAATEKYSYAHNREFSILIRVIHFHPWL